MSQTPQNATGVVDINDPLVRKKWLLEGLLEKASMSQWDGLKGTDQSSVVVTTTDISQGDGHEVHFQYNGKSVGKGVSGKSRLRGNEEQKRLFSDRIRVERVRHGLNNGDFFDAVNIGDLSIAEHAQSRAMLSDWNVRKRDQWLFDSAQGFLHSEGISHIIRPNDRTSIDNLTAGDTFSLDFIRKVGQIMKEGDGFTQGGRRAPVEPFTTADGRAMWLWMIDPTMVYQLMVSTDAKAIFGGSDVRGNDNRLIKGAIGTFDNFIFVEKQTFFGETDDTELTGSSVEIAGLRQVDSAGLVTGEKGFGTSGTNIASRSVILGANALQVADGKAPDYLFKESDDYNIDSGSAIEMYTNTQQTILYANQSDYKVAKRAGISNGIVNVEVLAKQISKE